jgi:mannose-6-phosphate isomerase-like protein (cupin superfamily)
MNSIFKSSLSHKYIKKFLTKVPDWKKIIYNIDLNIQNKQLIKSLPDYGIVLHNTFNIEEVDFILKEIENNNPNNSYSAHVYISLSKESKTFGKHKDESDVWYWQCIGSTQWKIFEFNETISYILEPGDIIYVPRGIFHDVIPLSPRVGISFGLDYLNKNKNTKLIYS